jgi:hypothetical protein
VSTSEIIGYKLFRLRKDGTLGPLFINRKAVVPVGVRLKAESHPTKGFAVRPGWHAALLPIAPHLKANLATGEKRVWCRVRMWNPTYYNRPESQGGTWVLSEELEVMEVLS